MRARRLCRARLTDQIDISFRPILIVFSNLKPKHRREPSVSMVPDGICTPGLSRLPQFAWAESPTARVPAGNRPRIVLILTFFPYFHLFFSYLFTYPNPTSFLPFFFLHFSPIFLSFSLISHSFFYLPTHSLPHLLILTFTPFLHSFTYLPLFFIHSLISFFHLLTYLSIYSFTHLSLFFIYLLISFFHSFTYLPIYSFTHLPLFFIHLLTSFFYLLTHLSIYSFTHLLIYLLIHLLTYLLIHSYLTLLFTHSISHPFYLLTLILVFSTLFQRLAVNH
jgi:hypothetical protein